MSPNAQRGPRPDAAPWRGLWLQDVASPRLSLTRAQIDSTSARLTGLFGLFFALQSIPVLSATVQALEPFWAWTFPIWTFGAVGIAVVSSLVGRGVAVTMGFVAVSYVAMLVIWPFAVDDPSAAAGQEPWLWYLIIVAIAGAAVAFPPGWAATYAVAVPAAFGVLRVLPAGGGATWPLAVLDAVYALIVGSAVVVVMTAIRQAASRVDVAQRTAMERYVEAAKQYAGEQERMRVDTVVHDRVLSTLLAASRSRTEEDRELVERMAEGALVALQSVEAESDSSATEPLSTLAERIRVLALSFSAAIAFSAEGDLGRTVPSRVLEGVYSATVQSISNSLQHGGDGGWIARTVAVRGSDADGFEVVIADTGRGFDVAAVPPDRLGLRVSIRERVASVGGWADVRSVPGAGTSVVIVWPRDESTPPQEGDDS
jgi:signal transduction histidine kinase